MLTLCQSSPAGVSSTFQLGSLRPQALAGHHSLRLDDRNAGRALEKLNEGLGCLGLLRTGGNRRREHDSLLEVGGEGTDDIETGGGKDINEKKAEFGVAFGNCCHYRCWIGLRLHLRLHGFGNT